MPFWFRHPSPIHRDEDLLPAFTDAGRRIDEMNQEARLTMAVNHMIAFVLALYGLYAICRFGFGWDPTKDPPPPTYTIHIPGVTN
eukprot:scaffold2830_cov131-Cylindrotheca_fusiformis.AAC.63